jgi:hypothetical protein
MLHSALDRHFVPDRPQDVIPAQETKEVGKGPEQRQNFIIFGPEQ